MFDRAVLVLALALLGSCKSRPVQAPDPTVANPPPATSPDDGEDVASPEDGLASPDAGVGDPSIVISDAPCIGDGDCVPAACCHAESCTANANAPSCDDVMCTEECRYGTLDCGGSCFCHEGLCAAGLSVAPPE